MAKKSKMKRPEQIIQIHVASHLAKIEAFTGAFTFFHVPNGGYRTAAEGSIFKQMGVRAGVPDLVIMIKGGKTVFIELKAGEKSKTTENQDEYAVKLKALGFVCELVCADNAVSAREQIMKILKREGAQMGVFK